MFRRARIPASLCIALLWLVAACASNDKLEVSSHFDPLAVFPSEASYRWDERANSMPDDPRLRTQENDRLIRSTIDEQFSARGYRPVTSEPYEYLLSYQFAAYSFYSAEQSSTMGTISLELVEARSDRRVWTGYAQANLYVGLSEEESRKRLGEGIARMLADFPPAQRPPK